MGETKPKGYVLALMIVVWGLTAFTPPPSIVLDQPGRLWEKIISFAQPNPTASSTSAPAATTPNEGSAQPVYVLYSTALTCSEIWGIHQRPPYVPPILEPSASLADLNSNTPYYYLVAMLIRNKVVDAQDCPGGGLQTPYVANTCGVERARLVLAEWQNMYDAEIIQASQNTGVLNLNSGLELTATVTKSVWDNLTNQVPTPCYSTTRLSSKGCVTASFTLTAVRWVTPTLAVRND